MLSYHRFKRIINNNLEELYLKIEPKKIPRIFNNLFFIGLLSFTFISISKKLNLIRNELSQFLANERNE